MKQSFIYLLILQWAVLAAALDYSDMEVIFRAGKAPQPQKLLGTWVGRCIHQADPYRHWPAFFQFRPLSKEKASFSQSHTWFNEQTEKYDQYTLKELESDPACKKWLSMEKWNPIKFENDSWVNTSEISRAHRATRLYNDGLREHIVVAYSIGDKASQFPSSFCYFNLKLSSEKE